MNAIQFFSESFTKNSIAQLHFNFLAERLMKDNLDLIMAQFLEHILEILARQK